MEENNNNAVNQNYIGNSDLDQSVMSVGQWMVTMIVLAIPCLSLIMAFVWGFGSGNLNRKNYCRAYLIFVAILFIVCIIILSTFGVVMLELLSGYLAW